MNKGQSLASLSALVAAVCSAACSAPGVDPTDQGAGEFTSANSTLVDLHFDGELVSASNTNLTGQIRAQMLYTVGHFNAERGLGQLPKLALSNVTASSMGGGLYRVTYSAILPVSWDRSSVPATYTLTLPRRVGGSADETFVSKYKASCADAPDEANASNYWYHYRPNQDGCSLADADVVRLNARVTASARNTTGKYPEYQRVWEDGVLRMVAVFGKYDKGATSDSDAGISAYNEFVSSLGGVLQGATVSPPLSGSPGAGVPEVSFELTRPGGQRVEATVILVNKLVDEGPSFDRRYAELSAGADIVMYDGHAGLGANVRALADKGNFFPGKYQIFFFNGCDTFAYIDDSLAKKRAQLNPDDPAGTRYLDILTNSMPAFFTSMSDSSLRLVKAMLDASAPRTYESIFEQIDSSQMVVVTGEEDNAFTASAAVFPSWQFSESGAVRKAETVSYETDTLDAGTYVFSLMPDPSVAGGDADLRVRAGAAPTITPEFKCQSYVANSNERCKLTLSAPSKVYIAVTGDSSAMASPFELRAFRAQ